ncbi:class I SAM-dependent methyltransferase [Curtobacterium flaccumfaciens]|nr:class I SAM-dependent methyltransferase [Curtobacterium flaccumfaciens]
MADLDHRLVALYDDDNPDGADSDFYRALCTSTGARSVIDLGCGTGSLTVSLADAGRSVVGVDPSATMIDYARKRPGADGVTWVLGDSRNLPPIGADYAVLTGNVAQHIPDGDWQRTLADLHHALRAGGTLAFESRNPAAGAWHAWSPPERTVRETASGPLEEWSDAREITPGVVRLIAHNAFLETGEHLTYTEDLFFRELTELKHQLDVAGFCTTSVYGDWQHGPVTDSSEVLVLVANAW